jgi:dihydrolipoamide dehydrogenase
MRTHDLLVVGGGAGNNLAADAAREGMDVGLVEKGPIGGACLTRGCDPSKLLLRRAHVVEQVEAAGEFGITAEVEAIDFDRVVRESNQPFDEKAEDIEADLRDVDGLTLYKGDGEFVDERTVTVDGVERDDERIEAEKVVVAVGARPAEPPGVEGLDDVEYSTSTDALRFEDRPDHLVVVGGGYVAAELGYFYGAMGAEVTVIGRSDDLLAREDPAVRTAFTEQFREDHAVHTGHEASAVSESDGEYTVEAEADDGEAIEVTGDELLLATGRTPNTDLTNVAAAGIETDDRGYVEVDDNLATTAENVWAFGDAIGPPMFRHTADHESEYVFANAVEGKDEAVDYTGNAHAVFASPEVASLGETEDELNEDDRAYEVGRAEYEDVPMGFAMKADAGFAKVLADPADGSILGCHILGPEASTLIHEVVTAVTAGDGTASDVTDAIHVHPR